MTKEEAIKYLQQLYPNGGHCWLDEQRIEAIGMAVKSMQEEPKYKFKVGDKVMPKRFTDNECGFYINDSARIVDIVGDYYILEGDKAYKIACQDNWELVEKTAPRRSKVKDREATGKLKECIDNITDESLAKARKQLQEEPVSEDFETALAKEWQGYVDRGAATVDALEDNTQELAFAKGFYRGWNYPKSSVWHDANKEQP